jgi:hypothetical protein
MFWFRRLGLESSRCGSCVRCDLTGRVGSVTLIGVTRVLSSLHALGRDGLPGRIDIDAGTFQLEQTVKHDFFAATGFYRADSGRRLVVKINRRQSLFGLPLRWLGRWLCEREVRAYRKLADVSNVPQLVGTVTDTGLAHVYVEGNPLCKDSRVSDQFFPELLALIDELNRRGLAYVDTNKPQNILLGDDGRPYLFDFQISFDAAAWWPGLLGRRLLRVFNRADRYHVLKHKRRIRPDQLTPAERELVERRGIFIRAHRVLTRPYFMIRRPLMRWLRSSGRVLPEGSK